MNDKITIDRSLLQQVLEALKNSSRIVFEDPTKSQLRGTAIRALTAALTASQPAQPEPVAAPHIKMTKEIDLVLSDPDTNLSSGAVRALRWLRTWVSVPLYTAPQTQQVALSEPDSASLFALEAQEPVLFIHPSTFEMTQAHVGAWRPGYELPGYIPLYTTPQPHNPTIKARVNQ